MTEKAQFKFHPKAAESINKKASDLLCKIKPVAQPDRPKDFPSDRPIAASIKSSELIAEPERGKIDRKGRWVERVFYFNDCTYGILQDEYNDLRALSELITSKNWPKKCLSRKFVEDSLFDWCRNTFKGLSEESYTSFLMELAQTM